MDKLADHHQRIHSNQSISSSFYFGKRAAIELCRHELVYGSQLMKPDFQLEKQIFDCQSLPSPSVGRAIRSKLGFEID